MPKNKTQSGFTLIEMIIYVALVGVVAVMMNNFIIQASRSYQEMRAEREVVSNSRLILEQLTKNISRAGDVYAPTSKFNITTGQLSLITASSSLATYSYTDFWLDNGQLWMRQEGVGAEPISASSVKVTSFYMERILQGLSRQAVKITLTVEYNSPTLVTVASSTLNSTISLRGTY